MQTNKSTFEVHWRGAIIGIMLAVACYVMIASIEEAVYDPTKEYRAALTESTEAAPKKDLANNYIASSASLYKTLTDIEITRNVLLAGSMRKKSNTVLAERKKIIAKKGKRKRSDPTDQKEKVQMESEPSQKGDRTEGENSVIVRASEESKNDQAGNEIAVGPKYESGVVRKIEEDEKPEIKSEISEIVAKEQEQAEIIEKTTKISESKQEEILKEEPKELPMTAETPIQKEPEIIENVDKIIEKHNEIIIEKPNVIDTKSIQIDEKPVQIAEQKIDQKVELPVPENIQKSEEILSKRTEKEPENQPKLDEIISKPPSAEIQKPEEPIQIVEEKKVEPQPERKPEEPIKKIEEQAEQPKSEEISYKQPSSYYTRDSRTGFDYRDQYRNYQSSVYGGRYSKRGGRYGKHTQTVYLRKSPHPSPARVTPESIPAEPEKKPDELKLETSQKQLELTKETVKTPEKEETDKQQKQEEKKEEVTSEKSTPVKSETSKDTISELGTFRAISNIEKPIEKEEPIEQLKEKSRTSSIRSEEELKNQQKRKGLGGVLLKLDEQEDEHLFKQKEIELIHDIIEEGSEKGPENDFYKCYNPFTSNELKLPSPFTIKEEREDEEEKHFESYYKTDKEIDLFEAFKSANSLLGDRSVFSEPHPLIGGTHNISPLSELRGDSVEYIPQPQRRSTPGIDNEKHTEQ